MNYGNQKIPFLNEKQKTEILSKILDACIDYAGDSYENFGRELVSILKNAKLVEYGSLSQNPYDVVKLPKNNSYIGNYGIFNNQSQKLVDYHGIIMTYKTKQEAEEIAIELYEKIRFIESDFLKEEGEYLC